MGEVKFDYSKLRGRIYEIFGSQKKFEEAMGISHVSLWKAMTNKRYFDQVEILQAMRVLGIDQGQESAYFFTQRL